MKSDALVLKADLSPQIQAPLQTGSNTFTFGLWQPHSNGLLNFAVCFTVPRAIFFLDTRSARCYFILHANILQRAAARNSVYNALTSCNCLKNFLRLKNCLACECNSGRILTLCFLKRKSTLCENASHVSLFSPTALPVQHFLCIIHFAQTLSKPKSRLTFQPLFPQGGLDCSMFPCTKCGTLLLILRALLFSNPALQFLY